MCDYSLMEYKNRLAEEGEDLLLTSFPSGCMGFAAAPPIGQSGIPTPKRLIVNLARMTMETPQPNNDGICAICIPEGARLRFTNIEPRFQASLNVSATEEVKFVQLSNNPLTYRDAVEFSNGRRVSLQKLYPGLRASVLTLGGVESVVHADQGELVMVRAS